MKYSCTSCSKKYKTPKQSNDCNVKCVEKFWKEEKNEDHGHYCYGCDYCTLSGEFNNER